MRGDLYLYKPAALLQVSTGDTGDRQFTVLHTFIIMLLTHGDMVFLRNLLICICMYMCTVQYCKVLVQQHDQETEGWWMERGKRRVGKTITN